MRPYAAWFLTAVRSAGWAPILVFALHQVLARVFDAYERVSDLDVPMHFVGGVAIAHFFDTAVHAGSGGAILGTPSRFGKLLLSLSLVGCSTIAWELAEWTTDHLGWSQAQGGLGDTMADMVIGLLGGLVYLGGRGFRGT